MVVFLQKKIPALLTDLNIKFLQIVCLTLSLILGTIFFAFGDDYGYRQNVSYNSINFFDLNVTNQDPIKPIENTPEEVVIRITKATENDNKVFSILYNNKLVKQLSYNKEVFDPFGLQPILRETEVIFYEDGKIKKIDHQKQEVVLLSFESNQMVTAFQMHLDQIAYTYTAIDKNQNVLGVNSSTPIPDCKKRETFLSVNGDLSLLGDTKFALRTISDKYIVLGQYSYCTKEPFSNTLRILDLETKEFVQDFIAVNLLHQSSESIFFQKNENEIRKLKLLNLEEEIVFESNNIQEIRGNSFLKTLIIEYDDNKTKLINY